MKKQVLSAVTASALAMVGAKSASANINIKTKDEENLRNIVHLKDLQTRLQVVCDRVPARETVDLYGTNPNGFRERKKFTKAEIAKMVA